ncbi:MAG: Phosphoenolpyruvate synthase/pyruvate phosphate dikinase [Candidatus Amesbacteria bacterium GW2011_GWA2_47_11b]|uniref:Phosphoenolpyruvate synthase/pyruvate phosphate dikinase n=1 Tax=Candidatus Amesbacteria bacterium GW2011_GWA2_47_11b TaxID=1618358 RepID=A0A0G1TRY7_9BACT|nr:MAG: Phosphoenolpyruvate synthase/pyruvate phosphate dikinase [Microgenomates group bacterium GW2011_GWC1_46_20]KKU56938.1 MAG: Phosphoenolpyruvate synthase/pyruvate phosphate dikinase [Candidatus Amesbacteria bacterium GW2011_GWA2_47_11b]
MGQQVTSLPKRQVEWNTVVNVKSDILFMSVNSIGLERKCIERSLAIDYEYQTLYCFNNTIAYSKEDLGSFFNLLVEKINSDRKFLARFPSRVYEIADSLLALAKRIKKRSDLTSLTPAQLNTLFLNYIEKCALAFPILVTSIPLEIIITGELEKFVREKLKERNILTQFDNYFQNLTQLSSKETYFQQDYRNLLKIGSLIQKSKTLLDTLKNRAAADSFELLKRDHQNIYRLLLDHNAKYAWINMYGFRRRPFSLADQVARLPDILDKDCRQTLQDIDKKRRVAKSNFYASVSRLHIKEELLKMVSLLPELVYLRTYRFDIFTLSAYMIRGLFEEIAVRLNLQVDDLNSLTFWEISDLLLGKIKINSIPLSERQKDYAVIQIEGQLAVISKPKALKKFYEQDQTNKPHYKPREFKGRSASKGVAKGPVKIVMHPTQITKVEKGDVLVAPMTSPDFVVGMLKAVAIVTDHGGVTCHAAIVSRELDIPCVVGTKIATQVLRDGDLVEVDATKGLIRLLQA